MKRNMDDVEGLEAMLKDLILVGCQAPSFKTEGIRCDPDDVHGRCFVCAALHKIQTAHIRLKSLKEFDVI